LGIADNKIQTFLC